MDEAEYVGVRVSLEAILDIMNIPLKIDISTGDAITPKEINYEMKLMFEDRKINILASESRTGSRQTARPPQTTSDGGRRRDGSRV